MSQTTLQELINEFECIKNKKCESVYEVLLFEEILSIIKNKYLQKEKEQIIKSYAEGLLNSKKYSNEDVFKKGERYFNTNFVKFVWMFKHNPNYKVTQCKKVFNTITGKQVKKVINGASVGFWVGKKFISLSKISNYIEEIPKLTI